MAKIPAVTEPDEPARIVHVDTLADAFRETNSLWRLAGDDEWPEAGSWQEMFANASRDGGA